MEYDIVLIGALCGFAALMVALWWRQEKRLSAARREAGTLGREIEGMRRDLAALCTGALGTGGHLGRIERELLRVAERQDRLERQGAAQGEYDRATRMIRGGAGVEELIDQCGLGRAEAELLLRMQAAQAPETGTGRSPRLQSARAAGMRSSGVPM